MTFETQLAEFVADTETFAEPSRTSGGLFFPLHDAVADPDSDWAARNPDRLMAFLLVTPRDCAAIDTLMAR